ncbi:MAG TPA: hypothetical protein VL331_03985 [Croceibacterium sp.]|nr:hypothetical protein [Croceibacterium sp.]
MIRSAFLRLISHWLGNAIALLMIGMVLTWFTVMFAVLPLVGLVTGDLYLPGKRPGLGTDVHGTWARLISAGLLVVFVYGARSFLKLFLTRLQRFRAKHGRAAAIGVWVAVAVVASVAGLAILGIVVGDNS